MSSAANTAKKGSDQLMEFISAVNARQWDRAISLLDTVGYDVKKLRFERNQETVAHRAAKDGSIKMLKELKERGMEFEGLHDESGQDIIHVAVLGNQKGAVSWLAEQGVDLDAPMKPNDTGFYPFYPSSQSIDMPPLQLCLKQNRYEMAECLLKAGASPDARNAKGETALMQLAQSRTSAKNTTVMRFLLAYGADFDAVNSDRETPLMYALSNFASYENFQVLLDAGAAMENPAAQQTVEEFIAAHDLRGSNAHKLVVALTERPVIDGSRPFSKADLFTPNEGGYAALDNPQTWRHIGPIMKQLAAQGEQLTKRDLKKENAFGQSWLERAIDCCAYNLVAQGLYEQGTPMRGRDFADTSKPGGINKLGLHAEKAHLGITDFADESYWQDKGAQAFSKFCQDLPEFLRDQIPSRHQLAVRLAAYEQEQDRGR